MTERQPLLLIPGLMCDARLYAPQLEGLADIADMAVADHTRGDTMTAIAAAILADAPWPRFSLAGLSMGGGIAMEILRQAGDRVDRLALLDTNHLVDTPERTPKRLAQLERVRKGELEALTRDTLLPSYLAPANLARADIVEAMVASACDLGPEVFRRQINALMTRQPSVETLRAFDRPALVLCGALDTLCPVALHREMAALLPASRLVIVPGAGHLVTLEAPGRTNAELRTWLAT